MNRTTLLALAVATVVAMPVDVRAQTAVIVNPGNSIADVSTETLRRLYNGKSRSFENGTQVAIGEHLGLHARFYDQLLGLAPNVVRQRWITLFFRGEVPTMPRELNTPAEVRQFVSSTPGALAFLELAECDNSVKILSVDGVRPGQAGYRFP